MKKLERWFIGFVMLGACLVLSPSVQSQDQSQEPTKTEKKDEKLQDKMKKSRGPTEITADELEIDNTKKIAIYTGNVVVSQDQTNIFTDKLIVYANDQEKLEKAVAVGDCRLVRETITATGNTCTYYDAEQKLEVEGNAKAWQVDNTLTGNRLIAYLDKDVVEAFADNRPERVVMTLHPKKESESKSAEKTSDGEPNKGFTSGKVEKTSGSKPSSLKESFKGDVPIVITADKVILDNVNRTATYIGNVVAVKATTELKAEKMIAYAQAEKDELLKIEVFDNVHITKDNMLFTGDRGTYYDDTQRAVLEGLDGNKARAEDKVKKNTLEAPIIEAFLAVDKYVAKGGPATTTTAAKKSRVKTVLPGDQNVGADNKAKSEEKKSEKTEVESPIKATLYPGGRKP
ncbi:MAG TPA: lipopolysaccharide transport periplasmic protein LptA [Candidatus Limnocylindrales bacterium]|nr:lipopolysaccharide transport periplasmic protein LptA [Candidatus Limnocylindrales bacterium]